MMATSENKRNRVAVVYICTGKYKRFFADFYESAKAYLLKDVAEVRYFVFTDDMELTKADDVELIKRECQGFPADSLGRFDMFLSIEDRLQAYDYTFFFNANMKLVAPIGLELLPEHLTAVVHPGYFRKPAWYYPYERNKQSSAYIPAREQSYLYYMGSLNGGKTEDYLEMARVCSKNIADDRTKGIVAKYHDESHLNHYLHYHTCTPLSPAYAYIEGKKMPFEPKIILVDKARLDAYFDKNRDHSLVGIICKGLGILRDGVKWYL
jgi:hypothetical protein